MTADTPTDLLAGVAQLLHDAGVVNWTGLAAPAAATGGLPACTLRQLPDSPAFCVTLFDYLVTANARLSNTTRGINFRVRSDAGPSRASAVSQQIFMALHAIGRRTLASGLIVTDIQYQSEAQLGPDQSGRHERSMNYYALVNQPGTQRE